MITAFKDWDKSVDQSVEGSDYEAGGLLPGDPDPRFWTEMKSYEPWFDQWRTRWEYESRFKPRGNKRKTAKP